MVSGTGSGKVTRSSQNGKKTLWHFFSFRVKLQVMNSSFLNTDIRSRLTEIAKEILRKEAQELLAASNRLNESIVDAVEIINAHSGKLVICGIGKSGLIGQKIVGTLCSTGTQAVFLHAADALHGDLGIYHPGDPTLLISKSGSTEEILRMIPVLREFNSSLIGILGNVNSPVAKKVDVVLDATVSSEADPLGIVPTSSTTLTAAIGDALAGALMMANGFNTSDFARVHPGGALGNKLRLTVKEVMKPLSDVAVVSVDTSLRKTVILMTEKPQGAAVVLGRDNRLKGIVTDGDIRRGLVQGQNIDKETVESIYTEDPIFIRDDSPFHDAVALMENRTSQISVLPVVLGETKECIGLLRIHDIYQTTLI